MTTAIPQILTDDGLARLIGRLRASGYRVVGPTLVDGVVGYGDIEDLDNLPRGTGDVQAAGAYRLVERDDDALFGFAVGPQSPKPELYPPRQRLWRAVREDETRFGVETTPVERVKLAFLGIRACELAAIAIQDRVLLEGPVRDTVYEARREDVVTVAVNCTTPGGTCFCASMGTGPRVTGGADVVLTEVWVAGERQLVTEPGTAAGASWLDGLTTRDADPADLAAVDDALESAVGAMGRTLDPRMAHDVLQRSWEHPHWEEVAQRCLACANCTLVCPTCFCTTMEDTTDLASSEAFRDRRWDSCFTLGFSHAGPGSVRSSHAARYRQWLTHKLSTWVEQFGTSGCVGCGRCITWCPVGIDITAEAAAFAHEAGDDTGDGRA